MKKNIFLLIAGIISLPAVLSAQVSAAVSQGNTIPAETVNPDNFFAYVGFGIVFIFIFLVILALSKSIGALSKVMGEKYADGHELNS